MNRRVKWVGLWILTVTAGAHGAALHAQENQSACATPEQAAKVQVLFAGAAGPAPFQAAMKLQMSESIVLSSLGPKRAVGVAGAEFARVWAALNAWPDAVMLITKGGHIFEIEGPIHPGEPSKKSKFFNLEHGASGVAGHLRPDLIGSIYAVDYMGGEGPLRGLVFLDLDGASVFSVFVPKPDEKTQTPSPADAEFEKTRALLAGMPQVCAGAAKP
jgi:putative heme iron utilization protein